jgi:malonyl-CoA/methylmalonyl-CoA synthetase
VPHRDLGEAVVAAVVPRSAGFADEAAIIAALAGQLARFKQPRRVIFLPELPKNSMGKVQKTVLRERFAATFAGD